MKGTKNSQICEENTSRKSLSGLCMVASPGTYAFPSFLVQRSFLRRGSGPLDQLALTSFLFAEFKVGIGEDATQRA